jgi:hypothetical protein
LDRPRCLHQRFHRRRAQTPFVGDGLSKPHREIRLQLELVEQAFMPCIGRCGAEIQPTLVDRIREYILSPNFE